MLKKQLLIFIAISSLTACSVNIDKPPEDYTGSDASNIRAKNYLPPLTLVVYQKSGNCYKEVDSRSLGPGFNIVGIKSTFNKKIPGMLPPSEELKGLDALEYRIKANQRLMLTYTAEVFRSQYNQRYETYTFSFIPKEGHDYDLYPQKSSIGVFDLTTQQAVVDGWDGDKRCQR